MRLALDFIDWFSFKDVVVDETMSLADYSAQYAAVQTNWVYTIAAILAIIVLLAKKNKKWYWYSFFIITAVMSFTSVGMHTANYGVFEPGVMTTKLLASYVDMSFTELMAWSAVSCFAMDLYVNNKKKRNVILIVEAVLCFAVLAVLTYEVFVLHNRPLYIGGGGAPMDGKNGGLSLAEFGCFLTALPILYVLGSNLFKMPKIERTLLIMTVLTFLVAFIITSLWGDNEINSILLGNFHGHSIWHILTGLGTLEVCLWVDQRNTDDKLRELGVAVDPVRKKKEKA